MVLFALFSAHAADAGLAREGYKGTVDVDIYAKAPTSCEVPEGVEPKQRLVLQRLLDDEGALAVGLTSGSRVSDGEFLFDNPFPTPVKGLIYADGEVSTLKFPAVPANEFMEQKAIPARTVAIRWCGPPPSTVAVDTPTEEGAWMRVGTLWFPVVGARKKGTALDLSTSPLACDTTTNAGEELMMMFMGTEPGNITWVTGGAIRGAPDNRTGQKGPFYEVKGDEVTLSGDLDTEPGSWEVQGTTKVTICP